MGYWWEGIAAERYWCEVTDKVKLGNELHSPQRNEVGGRYWSYDLMQAVKPGDVVFHYSKQQRAIVGASIAGALEERSINWRARGTSGRANTSPPKGPRDGWYIPLSDYVAAVLPLKLKSLQDPKEIAWLHAWVAENGKGNSLAIPFTRYSAKEIRPSQGYLFKMPAEFVAHYAPLAGMAKALPQGTAASNVQATQGADRAAVVLTDVEWFTAIRAGDIRGPISFWTPTDWKIKALVPGARVYFFLKAPVRKIGGFATFERYELVTVDQAWARYGRANGVESAAELRERTSAYAERRSESFHATTAANIGCLVLEDPVLFDDDAFIDPAEHGAAIERTVVKMKYLEPDLLRAATSLPLATTEPFAPIPATAKAYRLARQATRVGQAPFRKRVLAAYGQRCCVTGTDCEEILEAAHIQPYLGPASNHVQNGIALRVDLHRLFDAGLVGITPDLRVEVSPQLKDLKYRELHGRAITLPKEKAACPCIPALELRRASIFRR